MDFVDTNKQARRLPLEEPDVLKGFLKAVSNGQSRLSNDYLVEVVLNLITHIEKLEEKVYSPTQTKTVQPKKITVKDEVAIEV